MGQGLTLRSLEAEVDALAALEAAIGGPRFWNPTTLSHVSPEAVDAYLDRIAGRSPQQRRRLEWARILKETPIWDRIVQADSAFRGARKEHRRALAFAAGLPVELVDGRKGVDLYGPATSGITWLPDDLHAIGDLDLTQTGFDALPKGLRVKRNLILDLTAITTVSTDIGMEGLFLGGCPIEYLPEGLKVWSLGIQDTSISKLPPSLEVRGYLHLNAALGALSNEAIRSMAPGVTGEITRG